MKVFYTSSQRLPRDYNNTHIKALRNLGHTVFIRSRPEDYSYVSQKEAREVVKKNINNIKKCDVVVAEVSFISGSIGYHISTGITEKKPILILYDFEELRDQARLATSLLGLPSKYLVFKPYKLSNLTEVLKSSFIEIKDLMHTKFNFLVPPEISSYMEWQNKYKNRPKSELVREALEEKMRRDKEYLDSLSRKDLYRLD